MLSGNRAAHRAFLVLGAVGAVGGGFLFALFGGLGISGYGLLVAMAGSCIVLVLYLGISRRRA